MSCLKDSPAARIKLRSTSERRRRRAKPRSIDWRNSAVSAGVALAKRVLTLPWQYSSGLSSGANLGNSSTTISACSNKWRSTASLVWIGAWSQIRIKPCGRCRRPIRKISLLVEGLAGGPPMNSPLLSSSQPCSREPYRQRRPIYQGPAEESAVHAHFGPLARNAGSRLRKRPSRIGRRK
jgi:hypothetical protein